jgi:hypothetical protein
MNIVRLVMGHSGASADACDYNAGLSPAGLRGTSDIYDGVSHGQPETDAADRRRAHH